MVTAVGPVSCPVGNQTRPVAFCTSEIFFMVDGKGVLSCCSGGVTGCVSVMAGMILSGISFLEWVKQPVKV